MKKTNTEKSTLAVEKIFQSREIFILALLFLLIYFVMSLWSFQPDDSGLRILNDHAVHNSAGITGAWLADILFSGFGYMAWSFPLLIGGILVRLLYNRRQPLRWNYLFLYLYFPAFILALFSGCGLINLYNATSQLMPVSGGGIIGKLVLELLLPLFSDKGSTLLLVVLFLIGLSLSTGFSWLTFAEWTARSCISGLCIIKDGLFRLSVLLLFAVKRVFQWLFTGEKGIKTKRSQPVQNRTRRKPTAVFNTAPSSAVKADPSFNHINTDAKLANLPGKIPLSTLLLNRPADNKFTDRSPKQYQETAKLLEVKLRDFGIEASVVTILPGPVVTRFEIQPSAGTKVSKISNLATDLARSLSVPRIRVVEVIAGKSVIGIEVPNQERKTVFLSELVESNAFRTAKSPLSLALGQDISGSTIVADLAKMPHLLVAGTTGSGKSVGINTMILSLLYKASSADVRLIMIDPKMLELSVYAGIPHLLTPVVTDMKKAASALRWCVIEMERRYRLMAALGVRNITGFNEKINQINAGKKNSDQSNTATQENDNADELQALPFIVVVIDEFADMMMIVGKEVEKLIARIAQKARAAGIHLILATQRPSVDVITGLIKANIPARISYQVSSKIDSRTVIDQSGAEQLLGHGDMLYLAPGSGIPMRIHGAFISDEEVHRVVKAWKAADASTGTEDIFSKEQSNSHFNAENESAINNTAVEKPVSE